MLTSHGDADHAWIRRSPCLTSTATSLSTEALVSRVEELDPADRCGAADPGVDRVPGLAPLVDPVHGMRALHRELHPPDLSAGVRRARAGSGRRPQERSRRLTSWYVEPRFQVQEQIDARTIDFASEAYNAIHRLEGEIEDLRRQIVRAKLDVVATGERLRRQQAVTDEAGRAGRPIWRRSCGRPPTRTRCGSSPRSSSTLLDRLGRRNGQRGRHRLRRVRAAVPGRPGRHRRGPAAVPHALPAARGPGHDRRRRLRPGRDAGRCWPTRATTCWAWTWTPAWCRPVSTRASPPSRTTRSTSWPRRRPDSLKGVFCAQVVEHLLTSELEELVRRSLAALQPDGRPRHGDHQSAELVRPGQPLLRRHLARAPGAPRDPAVPLRAGRIRSWCSSRSGRPTRRWHLGTSFPDDAVGDAVRTLLENVFGYQDYVIVATK